MCASDSSYCSTPLTKAMSPVSASSEAGAGDCPGGQKIPHMGWNQVTWRKEHPFFEDVPDGSHFYFVHSYFADPEDSDIVAGTTDYGVEFCSAVAWDSVAAVQFHPEKSGSIGLEDIR